MGAGQSEPQGVGPEADGRAGKIRGSKCKYLYLYFHGAFKKRSCVTHTFSLFVCFTCCSD